MTTPRDLTRSTYVRFKQLLAMNGDLEDYILYAFTKITSFAMGVGLGYWLWAM